MDSILRHGTIRPSACLDQDLSRWVCGSHLS